MSAWIIKVDIPYGSEWHCVYIIAGFGKRFPNPNYHINIEDLDRIFLGIIQKVYGTIKMFYRNCVELIDRLILTLQLSLLSASIECGSTTRVR